MGARLSRETVTVARADEPEHSVTIAALKGLQRRAALEHCVGSQQKVERGPWSCRCKALHDVGDSWKSFSILELAGGIAPVASLTNGEQGIGSPSFVDSLTRDPQCVAGLLCRQRASC